MNKMARKPVDIDVTPVFQSTAGGGEVVCEIDGLSSHTKGGVIKLKSGQSYELNFTLPSAAGITFEADGEDAFWCNGSSCPTAKGTNGGGLANPTVSPDQLTLTVKADPPAGTKGYAFYRLNFTGGGSFDPVIIHD
jgi:hypothetical protein